MNKKLSLLAVSVAMVLAGCGSDSSDDSNGSTVTPATPVSGKFIDNAVEGMYYTTTSGKSGLTGSEGEYQAMSGDTITFYIGGENGLKVGAGSTRDILTPFEAAGKYQNALNLAILLQSLDKKFGNSTDNVLTIPNELRKPSADTLAAMQDLSLDDRSSTVTFLKSALGLTDSDIVSEADAIAHMESSFGTQERGGNAANPLMKVGKLVRQIQVTQNSYYPDGTKNNFVHADTLMNEDLYNRTRGMSEMTIRIDSADQITVLPGSMDSSVSEDRAAKYLTCINVDGQSWVKTDSDQGCDTNGDGNIEIPENAMNTAPEFVLSGDFSYRLRDNQKMSETEETESSQTFMPFSATKVSELNHYTANKIRDDRTVEDIANGDDPIWLKETTSGSFDPVTGVYTEIVKKEYLNQNDSDSNCDTQACDTDRTSEQVSYAYSVANADTDRYVDFTGTWETREFCTDGTIAVMKTTFNADGQTISGQECQSENGSDSTAEDIGVEGPYGYDEYSDMWWFGQTNRESKATLTELNTLVRFCDQNDYVMGQNCSQNNTYFVKWEYQPAGKNWDEGLLLRKKFDHTGNTAESVSIMQKVK